MIFIIKLIGSCANGLRKYWTTAFLNVLL